VDKYGIIGISSLSNYTKVLLAKIDPVEEARLVGLDQAMLPLNGKKTYFSENIETVTYREPQVKERSLQNNPRLNPNFIDFYDPGKLNILKDPENEIPMETYKVPTATLVLNEDGQPRQLKNILLVESLLIGAMVTIVTLLVQFGFCLSNVNTLTLLEASHASRGDKCSGKRVLRTKGLLSMVFNTVVGRLLRNLVSILAIALPSSLLILFIFVTFRLNGVLFTSWLGQYVSLEVGTTYYLAVAISLLI
jgi:hypothetical protein